MLYVEISAIIFIGIIFRKEIKCTGSTHLLRFQNHTLTFLVPLSVAFRYLDSEEKVLQTADCFVEGLEASSFYDTSMYPWITGLEANYEKILSELVKYENQRRGVNSDTTTVLHQGPTGTGAQGDGEWLGPRDTSGSHYGPGNKGYLLHSILYPIL